MGIFRFFRKTTLGTFLPGKHGTSLVNKYFVSDNYTAKTIMSRLLPEVKIEVIEDLKFPKEWISNKKKRSIVFICSAWKHHLKEIEHRQQLMDIIILSKIISENIMLKFIQEIN